MCTEVKLMPASLQVFTAVLLKVVYSGFVTPFRQQIAHVSRDRIFFAVIERVLKHVCPIITFVEGFCCYFFVSLFNSLLSLIPFAHA
jgi:hypothetical protein